MRLMRRLQREQEQSPYVLASKRGGPITDSNFRKIIARLGVAAKIGFPVHPHMLRHACGFALANAGHDTRSIQAYLGHRSIASTVIYTALSDAAFKGFWRG